jgi:glutathione S-transferase
VKIYDFAPSPNARKVRFVAYEIGLEPTFVNVNIFKGESHTPEFLAKNPNGRIPVLEDGNFILWESNAIVSYLAQAHPEKGLLPTDLQRRCEVDQWMFWQSAHLSSAVGKLAFERFVKKAVGMGEPDEAVVKAGLAEFKGCAEVLNTTLKDKEYLVGWLSLADFSVASLLTVHELCGIDLAPYPAIRSWFGRMMARESVKRGQADAAAAMRG